MGSLWRRGGDANSRIPCGAAAVHAACHIATRNLETRKHHVVSYLRAASRAGFHGITDGLQQRCSKRRRLWLVFERRDSAQANG